jgi:hypothetical protein
MNEKPLIEGSHMPQPVSPRAQSSSAIQTAIRLPHDEGKTLYRVNAVLGLYFDPDHDPKVRAEIRAEFVRALRDFPDWAVQRAFDAWVKFCTRRPTPGEIVQLAQREIQPLIDELAYRKRMHEAERERNRPLARVDASKAKSIIESAGFTPERLAALRASSMATTFEEAEAAREPPRQHWSERADPDGPEWKALRAARAANILEQAVQPLQRKDRPEEGAA